MISIKDLDHNTHMNRAIEQAKKAASNGEVPIGAVIVDMNQNIVGEGYNQMEQLKCQTGHAEVLAIEAACKKRNDWRLNDCWIYITLEPCIMCFGLIQLSRLNGIIFGARSPLFGFGYGKKQTLPLFKKDLIIQEGVKKEECTKLLQTFFQTVRKGSKP